MYIEPLSDKKLDFIAAQYDIKTRQAFKVLKLTLDTGLRFHHRRLLKKMDDYSLVYEDRTVHLSSFSEKEKNIFINILFEYLNLQRITKNLLLIRKLNLAHYNGKYYYLDGAIRSGNDIQIKGENGTWRKTTFLCPIDVSIANPRQSRTKYFRKYHKTN